jgi:hypothetical protein
MKKGILFLAFIFGMTYFALAQSTPTVGKRQLNQSTRIADGVASGDLTRNEIKQLHRQQKHIRHEKRVAKADGVVTRRERSHIRRDQRIANKSIYIQKNDAQKRL